MSDTAPETASEEYTNVEDREVSLRLDGVTKRFEEEGGEVVAVDHVSMDIYDGEFVVFVGPSGCGKTTTLRMVAGLEDPSEGRVEINGENVAGRDPRERNVAMVFQNYALYPHKTVRENLAFPLTIRKYPKDERQRKVEETAEMLGIGELLDRQPRDLSGGQQQRVALGRAIIRDPELFLFDEPLSNLDAKLRIQMRTELNKLHRRVGKTSVYVTHDQEEAMTLGDRVAVMNDGRLQQIAPPQEVYEHPANRFVAGFIGEPPMNFFAVELSEQDDERDGDLWLLSEAFELALPDEMAAALSSWDGDRERLVFGIRPEDLQDAALLDSDEIDSRRSFRAYVKVVEPMGSNVDLTLAPPGATDDESSEFTARVSNDTTASEGDTITVGVEVGAGHVFDAETGDNLTRDRDQ
ncbi:ABC transporter ATP-binding protein [Halorussus lipolyticus]|uniref:ABC transporter ATP-binding protein n=1 Tax=Halorussus lipolyticus TaxID=3034024 RepID=UPI0023E7A56C|nr:ATP-binding cassette domain-containing protein [Halorussus sp. DT80]